MTWIIDMTTYQKRRLPNPGLLDSLTRGGGVRHEHLARVLEARRHADRTSGAYAPNRGAGPARDPGPASLVDRIGGYYATRDWPWLVLACFVVAVVAYTLGSWLAYVEPVVMP